MPFLQEAARGVSLRFIGTPADLRARPRYGAVVRPLGHDEVAYIQFTSGTTRVGRGVGRLVEDSRRVGKSARQTGRPGRATAGSRDRLRRDVRRSAHRSRMHDVRRLQRQRSARFLVGQRRIPLHALQRLLRTQQQDARLSRLLSGSVAAGTAFGRSAGAANEQPRRGLRPLAQSSSEAAREAHHARALDEIVSPRNRNVARIARHRESGGPSARAGPCRYSARSDCIGSMRVTLRAGK